MAKIRRLCARLAGVALSQLIAGCAPDFTHSPLAAAPTLMPAQAPARLEQGDMIAADGTRLAARVWLPAGNAPPRAVIVAVHGFNDYSRAYAIPAASWQTQDIATFAYDQRGFGANPLAGRWAGTRTLCLDIATAVTLAQRRWPHVPVYLLGESMGGAEVLTLMAGTCGVPPPHPTGVILVAPAVWGRETMPVINRIALWTASRLIPNATFTGSGFHILASDNFPMLRQLGRDPLFIKATRSDTIYGLVDVMDAAYAAPPITNLPVLLMYGAHDQLIPPKPMRSVARRQTNAPGSQVRVAFYPHGWHMLLRDREHQRVAMDVSHWIFAPNAPLPSGADRLGVDFLEDRLPAPKRAEARPMPTRHERG